MMYFRRKIFLVFMVLIFLSITTLNFNLSAQDIKDCVVYLNDPRDTIRGKIEISSNLKMSKSVNFSPIGESAAIKLLSRQIEYIDIYNSGLHFKRVPYSYKGENGEKVEGVYRLGQIIYFNSQFELIRLERFDEEFNYNFIEDVEQVYYVFDKHTNKYYLLNVEEEILSARQFRRLDTYKSVLNFILRDWDKRGRSIEKTKFSDTSLEDLLVNYSNELGDADSLNYSYSSKEDLNFVNRSVIDFGLFSGKSNDAYSVTTGLSLSYTYERNNPRRSKNRFDQFGIELVSSKSDYFNNNMIYENINVVNLYVGNRFLLTKNDGKKVKFNLNFGLSNYTIFISGSKDLFRNVEVSTGVFERVFVGTEPFDELAFLPFNLRLGSRIEYSKLSLHVFGDVPILRRFKYLTSPIGVKMGFYL